MSAPLIIDAHADTLYRRAGWPGQPCDLSLDRLRTGGVALQVLALFVGDSPDKDRREAHLQRMLAELEMLKREGWTQVDDPFDLRPGHPRLMLSIEGCEYLEDGLHTIAPFRQMGVRMAGLTWNYENRLATPAAINQTDGLKPYGLEAARELQRQGIALDVSHLNIPGFYDVLNRTNAPPVASHSNCRALCDHPRNLDDAQLKALFMAGGWVGINFFPVFLAPAGQRCDLDTVVNHIDHMHQLGGAGHVGFGSDFDGISAKPEGLDNPGDFPALLRALARRGYSPADLEAIAGGSFLRYYERITPSARHETRIKKPAPSLDLAGTG
ncbi:MAG: membrane dipeptidase [Clostridiales bacterium]|nr:membrane dipeptidase [Clostridiales bacterium]